jgi:hypothetical protein
MKHATHISGTRVSFLPNMHKKEYLHIILYEMPPVPTRSIPVGTHTRTYVSQLARVGPAQETPCGPQAV